MKRITDTSREAFDALAPLQPREATVMDALGTYRRARGMDPTAYELLHWLQVTKPTIDLNGIRPRLTALRDAGRVETTGKRTCRVTGKRVFTWAIAAPRVQPKATDPACLMERLF